MFKNIALYLLVIVLAVSGIGTAFNQEALTQHLVEIGMCKWQFARIYVFLYTGFALIPALILGFKLHWSKYLLPITFILLIFQGFDAYYTFKFSETTVSGLIPWLNVSSSAIGALQFVLVGISCISAGIVWGAKYEHREVPFFVYLMFLPLFVLSFASEPIYATDFETTQSDVPEKFSVERVVNMFENEPDGDFACLLVSVSCEACVDLTKNVVTTIKSHKHISVYIITSTSNSNLDAFIEHTALDTSKLEIVNINNTKVFRELVEHAYPHGYIVEDNEIIDHRVGLQCNMNFLDKIIR